MKPSDQQSHCSLDTAYDSSRKDIDLAEIIRRYNIQGDEELTELIEADGRIRLKLGRPIELQRYLDAIPSIRQHVDALDAAIDVTLRSMHDGDEAELRASVQTLIENYPDLEQPIRDAAFLDSAIYSTRTLRSNFGLGTADPGTTELPRDFGPIGLTGQHRYRFQLLLGRGSLCDVYLAEDRQLSEPDAPALVAVKVLRNPFRTVFMPDIFLGEEATKARRINHPGVARVLDRGVTDCGEPYIVYEYISGGTLADKLKIDPPPIDPRRAAQLVAQIARGVHAAHVAGLVHGDIKPQNILLTRDGQPRVTDFGIAVRIGDEPEHFSSNTHGANASPVGALAYIAPEQYRMEANAFSTQADIYALGGLLYHMLTGVLPNGETEEQIDRFHSTEHDQTPVLSPRQHLPSLCRDLDRICQRALCRRPADRHPSAAALADDLDAWLRREPIGWTKPSPLRIVSLWTKRRPALATLAACLFFVVLTSIVLINAAMQQSRQERHQAQLAGIQLEAQEARARQQELERQLRRQEIHERLSTHLDQWMRFGGARSIEAELLVPIHIIEWTFGPAVLGSPYEMLSKAWDARLHTVRGLLDEAKAAGTQDTFEVLLWHTMMALWLTSAHQPEDAFEHLEASYPRWKSMLDTEDPWFDIVEIIRLSAEARLIMQSLDPADEAPAEAVQALEPLDEALAMHLDRLNDRQIHAQVRRLAIEVAEELNSPSALDNPDRAKHYRNQLRDLGF